MCKTTSAFTLTIIQYLTVNRLKSVQFNFTSCLNLKKASWSSGFSLYFWAVANLNVNQYMKNKVKYQNQTIWIVENAATVTYVLNTENTCINAIVNDTCDNADNCGIASSTIHNYYFSFNFCSLLNTDKFYYSTTELRTWTNNWTELAGQIKKCV